MKPFKGKAIADDTQAQLFELPPITAKTETCRECAHRFAVQLNEFSRKVLQCCEFKKGRNNAGYKTIKVTDTACKFFQLNTK